MKLIKAALGMTLSDEEWRTLEATYGGEQGPTEQAEGRKRSWGKYQNDRDQLVNGR